VPGVTVTKRIHFSTRSRGKREIVDGAREAAVACASGRVPRVSRLMALAIRLDEQVREGAFADHSEIAAVGHVTTARVSQILALTYLAPDIQEALLFLPPVVRGRDPLGERDLRPLTIEKDWARQREMWASLRPPGREGSP